MKLTKMPSEFQKALPVLEKIKEAGFEAYFVGGSVRDALLNRPIHDVDIATSSYPEETKQIFPRTADIGIEHGTVLVLDGDEEYEVTTFRTEDVYVDYRRPSSVSFVRSLEEDLKRRDFTVNAFALGAVLLMQFAVQAAKYFPNVEIIELHHDKKKDAPSGTAIKTAELMAEVRESIQQGASDEEELIAGARGADFDGMRIHSVRLPGLVAHQEVIFGNQGEGLTLRHDSYDRSSFMTGVNLGIKEVVKRHELVYGLEYLL